MSELSLSELDAQHTELLPEREALGTFTLGSYNHAHVYNISQSNTAVQKFTALSQQNANNVQVVTIL